MTGRDTTILNSLIATTIDSANGYEEAAKRTQATELASQFGELARDRWAVVTTLQREVGLVGGTPKQTGTAKAAAHRRWLDLKNSISGGDRAVLQEVENGETYIRSKYEAALQQRNLTETARRAITVAFKSVQQGHDRVRTLNRNYSIGLPKGRQTNWRLIGLGVGVAALGGALYSKRRRKADATSGRPVTGARMDHNTPASGSRQPTVAAAVPLSASAGPATQDEGTTAPRRGKRKSASSERLATSSLSTDRAESGLGDSAGFAANGGVGNFGASSSGGDFDNR